MADGPNALRVDSVPPGDFGAVLPLLFPALSVDEATAQLRQLLAPAEERDPTWQGLLQVRRAEQLLGCLLSVSQLDGTLFVWPPAIDPRILQTDRSLAERAADALLQQISARLRQSNSQHGQCLLDPDDTIAAEQFRRNGFEQIAELLFMQARAADDTAATAGTAADDSLAAATDDSRLVSLADLPVTDRLAAVLERTWQDSRDCPGYLLHGNGHQALASHRLSGEFREELWFLLESLQGDCGLILLGDHPELNALELVYLGIAPEARGHGYGERLTRHALQVTRREGRETLFLAVDRVNDYAIRVYRRCGFLPTVRRQAWLLQCDGGPGHSSTCHAQPD